MDVCKNRIGLRSVMADHTIHNERTKLTATYANGVAISIFAVGGLGPWLATLYGNAEPGFLISLVSVICFLASVGLHFYARRILKRLRP